MAYSMTGFARTEVEILGRTTVIELSSVNHRFLELYFRLPGPWAAVEPALREVVKGKITRGKITVSIRYGQGVGVAPPLQVDEDRARQYIEAARTLMHLMRSTDSLSLDRLISLEGVITVPEEDMSLGTVPLELSNALSSALDILNEARLREGTALLHAIEEHINTLEQLIDTIADRAPELLAAYEAKLRQRIQELNAEAGIKEERIALEVAIMADRMDITEELVRFKAHLCHAKDLLHTDGSVGRDLNFLVQEMQREANTLGSKLRDVLVSRLIVDIKTEIEKIREQVQNIE